MYIFVIVFLSLLIFGVKLNWNAYIETPLEYKSTIALRGICALEIVIGHIGVASQSPWLFINRKAGVLVVGLFFFLSGYGLMYSLEKKENYMNKFLQIRMLKILLPALFVYLIYYVIEIIANHMHDFTTITIQYVLLWKFPQKINWYVTELLFLYLVFYFFYKYLSKRVANVIVTLICLGTVVVMWYIGMGNPWYGSTLCFPLGIIYAQNEKKFYLKLEKKYIVILGISIALICIGIFLFFALDESSLIANLVGRNIASVSFCVAIIVILMKVRIGNRITDYIGTISYELFLVHELFVFQEPVEYNLLYSLFAFIFSIASAILLHMINTKLQGNLISKM